jgi:hypothetical protein
MMKIALISLFFIQNPRYLMQKQESLCMRFGVPSEGNRGRVPCIGLTLLSQIIAKLSRGSFFASLSDVFLEEE